MIESVLIDEHTRRRGLRSLASFESHSQVLSPVVLVAGLAADPELDQRGTSLREKGSAIESRLSDYAGVVAPRALALSRTRRFEGERREPYDRLFEVHIASTHGSARPIPVEQDSNGDPSS